MCVGGGGGWKIGNVIRKQSKELDTRHGKWVKTMAHHHQQIIYWINLILKVLWGSFKPFCRQANKKQTKTSLRQHIYQFRTIFSISICYEDLDRFLRFCTEIHIFFFVFRSINNLCAIENVFIFIILVVVLLVMLMFRPTRRAHTENLFRNDLCSDDAILVEAHFPKTFSFLGFGTVFITNTHMQ